MKAIVRVKSPAVSSAPVTNSMAPEVQDSVNSTRASPVGKPTILDRPCSKNSNATTMRTMLST